MSKSKKGNACWQEADRLKAVKEQHALLCVCVCVCARARMCDNSGWFDLMATIGWKQKILANLSLVVLVGLLKSIKATQSGV